MAVKSVRKYRERLEEEREKNGLGWMFISTYFLYQECVSSFLIYPPHCLPRLGTATKDLKARPVRSTSLLNKSRGSPGWDTYCLSNMSLFHPIGPLRGCQ